MTEHRAMMNDQYILGGSISLSTILNVIVDRIEASQNDHHSRDQTIHHTHSSLNETTTFTVNMITNVILDTDTPLIIFTLGIPVEMIVYNLITTISTINPIQLYSGQLSTDDWERVTSTIFQLQTKAVYFNEEKSLSPSDLRQYVLNINNMHYDPIEAIVIEAGRGEVSPIPS